MPEPVRVVPPESLPPVKGQPLPTERVGDDFVAVSTADLLALYNIARMGLAAGARPAPKWTASYRAIRAQLENVGAIAV